MFLAKNWRVKVVADILDEKQARIHGLTSRNLLGQLKLQLTAALTGLKGPIIFICYKRISVIANLDYKENFYEEWVPL